MPVHRVIGLQLSPLFPKLLRKEHSYNLIDKRIAVLMTNFAFMAAMEGIDAGC